MKMPTLADVAFDRRRQVYDWMYRRGAPWDGHGPKPDLVALLESGRLDPATTGPRAIDIGCGTGTTSRLLAAHGFDVVGVDVSPVAIAAARDTPHDGGTAPRFAVADLLALPDELAGPYDLLVDIGTLDDFPRPLRPVGASVVAGLARPGSTLVSWCFYGHDRDLPRLSFSGPSRMGAPGIEPDELVALFGADWSIERVAGGVERRSACFLMTRDTTG